MKPPRSFILSLALLCTTASVAIAQKNKEPKRPKLASGADTNDAHAYYDLALQVMTDDADKAADALYWATRLNPTWADAFYARRVALHLTDTHRLERYWQGDRRTIESDDIKRIDSLYLHALTLNPFVSERLDHVLFEGMLDDMARTEERRGNGSSTEVRYAFDLYLKSASADMRAWQLAGVGDYQGALSMYAMAIKGAQEKAALRIERAHVLFQVQQLDSALAELTAAADEMRKRDKKELVYVYESKALVEHTIAVVYQQLGKPDSARAAYGRALQEDLSYYPAHMQLAFMSLEAKDTTAALAEMDLAVQLRDDDASVRYIYGATLASVGHAQEAEAQFRKALELDPVYAVSHFGLAQLYDKTNRGADALKEYRAFLALSARSDLRRDQVQARVAALAAAAPGVEPESR